MKVKIKAEPDIKKERKDKTPAKRKSKAKRPRSDSATSPPKTTVKRAPTGAYATRAHAQGFQDAGGNDEDSDSELTELPDELPNEIEDDGQLHLPPGNKFAFPIIPIK